MICKTKNGIELNVVDLPDVGENEGGVFCEVYSVDDTNYDNVLDYIVVHREDVDCSNDEAVEKYIKDYIHNLEIFPLA